VHSLCSKQKGKDSKCNKITQGSIPEAWIKNILKQSTNHLLHLGFDSEMLVFQIIIFDLQSNQKHFEIPDILTSFFFLSKS
jgi:hypothetical protein